MTQIAQIGRDEKDKETYAIIGAAMEVHGVLGTGFLESVYHQAFALELDARGIDFRHEVALPVHYKRQKLATSFRADFVCFGRIVVELKAQARLAGTDNAQMVNYLKASGMERGLLLNFGAGRLEYRRLIMSHDGVKTKTSSFSSASSAPSAPSAPSAEALP